MGEVSLSILNQQGCRRWKISKSYFGGRNERLGHSLHVESGETFPFAVELSKRMVMVHCHHIGPHTVVMRPRHSWVQGHMQGPCASCCPHHQDLREGFGKAEGNTDVAEGQKYIFDADGSLVWKQPKTLYADLNFSFSGLNVSLISSVRLSDQTNSAHTLLIPHILRALGLPGALSSCPVICEYT